MGSFWDLWDLTGVRARACASHLCLARWSAWKQIRAARESGFRRPWPSGAIVSGVCGTPASHSRRSGRVRPHSFQFVGPICRRGVWFKLRRCDRMEAPPPTHCRLPSLCVGGFPQPRVSEEPGARRYKTHWFDTQERPEAQRGAQVAWWHGLGRSVLRNVPRKRGERTWRPCVCMCVCVCVCQGGDVFRSMCRSKCVSAHAVLPSCCAAWPLTRWYRGV